MMPSLDDQERIFVNKYVYRLEPIQRGDIDRIPLSSRSLEEFYQESNGVGGRQHSY